jgi:hypothetical protein
MNTDRHWAGGLGMETSALLPAANRSWEACPLKEGLPDSPFPFTPTNKKHGSRQ